jgi:hypothetical protein
VFPAIGLSLPWIPVEQRAHGSLFHHTVDTP